MKDEGEGWEKDGPCFLINRDVNWHRHMQNMEWEGLRN